MKFETVNEIEKFSFRDAKITQLRRSGEDLVLDLEGLIVLPGNSVNREFSASYAKDAVARFTGFAMEAGIKEGLKKYDANENLVSVIEDETLTEEGLEELLMKKMPLSWLYDVQEVSSGEDNRQAVLGIEMPKENESDPTEVTDAYQLKISYQECRIGFEGYLSRVQS
ncbi:MAG: hypothetical protein IIT72_02550 [Lachnospiraceae bacterium]|nr:hypothetical protein [Lachnospiraceae bacterium]MBQ2576736.1 hypothetical protein [Lachnospiraceae bacterium]MBQ5484348.1 hypothetical protein [Lachnospiraceae bacterium]